jgi:hypothetical protein
VSARIPKLRTLAVALRMQKPEINDRNVDILIVVLYKIRQMYRESATGEEKEV